MKRLAVLASKGGTAMLPLIEAVKDMRLNAEISLVLSNQENALALTRARACNLSAQFVNPNNLKRQEHEQKINEICTHHQIDFILLAGYMRILSFSFVKAWENKIINVHPSLLPAHAGKMDLAVHQAVLDAQEKETGCTVHFVTAKVDGGPLILQKKCEVFSDDTAETLKDRVQKLEGEALIEAMRALL